jgi:hypothetical protein
MEHLFIPYDQALELKQLGFDESCFGMYTEDKDYPHLVYGDLLYSKITMHFLKEECLAPIYSQAFTFFREKYDLPSWVYESEEKWFYKIVNGDWWEQDKKPYSHKEAELECLKKLIEIVKNQQNDRTRI